MKQITNRQILKDGQVVFREGQPASTVYLVAQGEVELIKQVENNQKTIAVCKTGEFVGINALLPKKKYSATAKVKNGATVIPVQQTALTTQFAKMDKLTRNVVTSVIERLNALLDEKTDQ